MSLCGQDRIGGWVLDFTLGVLLASCPMGRELGEGVTGLDKDLSSVSRPSSSSITCLLHRLREFELSSGGWVLSDCMWELIRLTSLSPGSEASDGALLLCLRVLPVPVLRLSWLLLAMAWYSCSGMLILYFILAMFFSICPSSASMLADSGSCSSSLVGVFGWGSRSLG